MAGEGRWGSQLGPESARRREGGLVTFFFFLDIKVLVCWKNSLFGIYILARLPLPPFTSFFPTGSAVMKACFFVGFL